MCGVYLITIVAAIRVHVRCDVTGTTATESVQLTRTATGDRLAGSWEFLAMRGLYRWTAHFVRLFYAQLLLNILQNADTYIYASPNGAGALQIGRARTGVMFMFWFRGCPNEIAIIWP